MVYLLELNPLWLIDEGGTFATPLPASIDQVFDHYWMKAY